MSKKKTYIALYEVVDGERVYVRSKTVECSPKNIWSMIKKGLDIKGLI